VAELGLALTIKHGYLHTFVSLQTGYADTQRQRELAGAEAAAAGARGENVAVELVLAHEGGALL
jgi:hypothetical protein